MDSNKLSKFQKLLAIFWFLWDNFDLLKELLPELRNLKTTRIEFEKATENLNKINASMGDVDKLVAFVSEKALAETERNLFLASANEEMLNTIEGVDTAIAELEAVKQGIETSPAAGSRMIMQRNLSIAEINRKLEGLYKQRTRVAEASKNGTK